MLRSPSKLKSCLETYTIKIVISGAGAVAQAIRCLPCECANLGQSKVQSPDVPDGPSSQVQFLST